MKPYLRPVGPVELFGKNMSFTRNFVYSLYTDQATQQSVIDTSTLIRNHVPFLSAVVRRH